MNEFEKKMLDGHREKMRGCAVFECAVCRGTKSRKEGAGVRLWRPEPGPLMNAAKNKVATYAICLECAELPEPEIHTKATTYLASQGLFS